MKTIKRPKATGADMQNWLDNAEHLPKIMRDFHDQKDIFKFMHKLYSDGIIKAEKEGWKLPSCPIGHTYVLDYFLWFMAKRGYTLQKSRKKLDWIKL